MHCFVFFWLKDEAQLSKQNPPFILQPCQTKSSFYFTAVSNKILLLFYIAVVSNKILLLFYSRVKQNPPFILQQCQTKEDFFDTAAM
jgi:hypothetical protein